MRIGVVSDTHGHFDSRLAEVLAGVETILHAGDVDTFDVLEELGQIAPVRGVRGNVDGLDLRLPLSLKLSFEKVQIEMVHIPPVHQSEIEDWADLSQPGIPEKRRRRDFLKSFDPATRVVIFGHSHQPCLVTMDQKLFFNPGSAGKRRFSLPRCCGWLEITSKEIRASLINLEDQGEILPGDVSLKAGV